MPKITTEKAEEKPLYPVLPADTIIQVEVADIDQRTATNKNNESWEKLEFKFRITAIPDALRDECASLEGSHIWGSVPLRLTTHQDNKLRQWAEALIGVELGEGYELDTDDLVGKRARAVISNYNKKNGDTAHQVSGLLNAGGQLVGAATSTAAPAAAAADWLGSDDPAPF